MKKKFVASQSQTFSCEWFIGYSHDIHFNANILACHIWQLGNKTMRLHTGIK